VKKTVTRRRRRAVAKEAAIRKSRVGRRGWPAKRRIGPIIAKLKETYPDATCALTHENPLQLLVATILSAQCTDARVNMVTPGLFRKYHTAADFARAVPAELEEEIKPTGFFRNKTKSILGMAQAVVERHGGTVPNTMEELVKLPGVGRKTANVVLGTAFGLNEGVVVDTHVARLTNRLDLTRQSDPVKIEQDMMKLVPRAEWTNFSHLLIHHGRQICEARRPKCEICPINDLCPSSIV
jgi:endonuclease-3